MSILGEVNRRRRLRAMEVEMSRAVIEIANRYIIPDEGVRVLAAIQVGEVLVKFDATLGEKKI